MIPKEVIDLCELIDPYFHDLGTDPLGDRQRQAVLAGAQRIWVAGWRKGEQR